ncbi:MAG: biotin/lipoyl-binding protein [Bacteroidetes bacterium]|nr:biotin/lipoyl-binding protein [Bacteroidota bacterium]
MLQIKVNTTIFSVALNTVSEFKAELNGKLVDYEMEELGEGRFLLRRGNEVVELFVLSASEEGKEIEIQVGQNYYKTEVQTEFDQLLGTMGFKSGDAKKLKELKSPMPGKIISVLVDEGAEVKAGDPLLVLEAMKMENVLQCLVDGKVDKIMATKGASVNKNDILIKFV